MSNKTYQFYTEWKKKVFTRMDEMARERACKKNTDGFVSSYAFDTDGLSVLDLLDGNHTVLNWLALPIQFRTFKLDPEVAIDARDCIIDHCSNNLSGYYYITFFVQKQTVLLSSIFPIPQSNLRFKISRYSAGLFCTDHKSTVNHLTLGYRDLMVRINQAIGHIKLADLRPQHLNSFYKNLSEPGIRIGEGSAKAKIDMAAWLKKNKLSRGKLAEQASISAATVGVAVKGEPIKTEKAQAIAAAMGKRVDEVFRVEKNMEPLSDKTILEHHRLISTILAQAEKEMLVPYNTAAKATPPRAIKKDPNYFQPETISAILEALESEPLKWRLITHLLIVTGCRRGEVMGLKWEKVDFDNSRVKIDRALVSSKSKGVFEESTKTSDIRYLRLPRETIDLLRQHKREQLCLQLANGDRWIHTGYVFTQDNGDHMNPDSITGWLKDFSSRHGLPHINPHAFRHTVASVLLANGTDIVTVSKQLGHASVTTTESFYSHIIEENKARAADCIADVLIRKKA